MAVPPPEIILLAKSYAHQISLGRSAAEAGRFLRSEYGATAHDVTLARYQAQRAMQVGEALSRMGPLEYISEALEGKRQPAPTVGVRVELRQWLTDPPSGDPWRVNTLYVEVGWGQTLQDVIDLANEWLKSRPDHGYNVKSTETHFVGPTLWPGGTRGLRLGE